MANLQAHIPDIDKKNFDINTTAFDKSMTEVVKTFVKKFNANPEVVMRFLYSTQH